MSEYDKNISPVGWYVCSYLLRFIELAETGNDNPEARFISWENTILVKANSIEEAYDKAVLVALEAAQPYKGGTEGVDVQWEFLGMTEVLPVYEELVDGAEIMWCSRNARKLKNLRKRVRQRDQFRQ